MRNGILLVLLLISCSLAKQNQQQVCPNTFQQYDYEQFKCHTKITGVAETMHFIGMSNQAADICFNGTQMLMLFTKEISRKAIEDLCLISAKIYRTSLSNIEECEWILSQRKYNRKNENITEGEKSQTTKELTMELKKIVQVKYRLSMLNLILVSREYPQLKENITNLMDQFDNAGQFNEFSETLRTLNQEA